MTTTIRLILEYDGTRYVGWQIQPNGLSVQELVESALAQILHQSVRLHSAGRTDAGVHARGMVAHFAAPHLLPMAAFREGVNRFLPHDVAVLSAVVAEPDFHARFSARGKWYRYTVYLGPVRSPLNDRYAWHLRTILDLQAMAAAAAHFVGHHDFAAFRTAGCEARTTERKIFSCELVQEGPLVHFDVKGSGFLKNMVRSMVGTLVEVGLGRRAEDDIRNLLEAGAGRRAGRTAPARGLCLMEVWY